MPMNTKLKLLFDILAYRRPHNTKTERKFTARFIDTVAGMQKDAYGNRILKIGESGTLVSCHLDTVHSDGGLQCINYNSRLGIVSLSPSKESVRPSKRHGERFKAKKYHYKRDCLGTDDGSGMFIALSMIAAKIPALYVFHRGEEQGGLGSSWIERNSYDMFTGIERAIAFDRRGTKDIITHQMMGRCASDEFATAFSDLLGMGHSPCSLGTFTDTANYTDIVGECTNVSVGYGSEHTAREYQDTEYLQALTEKLCTVNLDSLPSVRKPGESDYADYARWSYKWSGDSLTSYRDVPAIVNSRAYLDSFLRSDGEGLECNFCGMEDGHKVWCRHADDDIECPLCGCFDGEHSVFCTAIDSPCANGCDSHAAKFDGDSLRSKFEFSR